MSESPAREVFERDLERRKYQIVIGGYDWASENYPNDFLLHHEPCGLAVINPDIHDTMCPAKKG